MSQWVLRMDRQFLSRAWRAAGWLLFVFLLFTLCPIASGSPVSEAVAPKVGIFLEECQYYTTDDKIILDLLMDQPVSYNMTYAEADNQIIVELPGVDGENLYADVEVDDSVLYRVTIGPLVDDEVGGVQVVLSLRHKIPEPVAFRVRGGRRLLVEAEKEFRQGFETFIVPGLAYGHWRKATLQGPLFVNYMRVDLRQPGLRVGPVIADQGRKMVHELAAQYDAIAGVNGVYFAADGRPLGVVVIDGKLISPPYFNRTAAGLWADGTVRIDNVTISGQVRRFGDAGDSGGVGEDVRPIDGVNRVRYADELIVYTPDSGLTTGTNNYGWEVIVEGNRVIGVGQGNSTIPENGYVLSGHGNAGQWLRNLEIGDYIEANWKLTPDWLQEGVLHAIGGGPRLLRNGEIVITGEEERFQADITQGRAPRTALGVTAAGELLLVTVNGRQSSISIGMTLEELAELMLELGAVDAMNLDGGGSSTMVVRGIVLNAPSDGKPRPVSNALLVWAEAK
ncbi:MAG: phosphodiester glycosidase family protein [Firmicutes bacterium]|nr:phosphodiester glycosidase family protein [Bacillota bacterium]